MKKKVKICRRTGLPVDLSDLDTYKSEFKRLYDKAERLCGKDMLRLNKKIAKFESALQKIYPTVVEVEFPKSVKAWKTLQQQYGNILVAAQRDSGDLLLVIEDQEEMRY